LSFLLWWIYASKKCPKYNGNVFFMMGIATIVWLIFRFSLAFLEGGSLQNIIGNPLTYSFLKIYLRFGRVFRSPVLALLYFKECSLLLPLL